MKVISLICIVFLLIGCSGGQVTHDITKTQKSMSGNKPPASFKVANIQTMNDYVFTMKGYEIAMPSANIEDFKNNNAWAGFTHYNKDIVLYLSGYYHISISTKYQASEYGERARAVDKKDQAYIKFVRKNYKYPRSVKLYYETLGKENYECITKERVDRFNRYKIAYDCYKFNPQRTKSKYVTIVLTYNKPKNKTLAKQYTFSDLKRRSKRMLDSLYINDDW